ncbi:DUF3261 domain-containing protein [Psychromonas sp. RZ22]|uniref:DUF3261 domain-containing protein n=1 Tax=Psychromonas algarum TaxID=2555643 RepID=UPI001068C735|nr:DUF3261 domain-containing protein [Psychromonas sp. RZ22]TEW54090.1 DUF3261 domain-containing protein [Psychromonas sp. RZ22]
MKRMIVVLSILLSACSMQPKMQQATHPVQVEITPGQFVNLPQPKELQQNVNVSQLITAQWGEANQQQMLTQLQVDQEKVVLAGFSAWGVKLLSLTYLGEDGGNKIETNVIAGFADKLPQPEQVLFNVMLSIWPKSSWDKPLAAIGWKLKETALQRLLIDQNGKVVVTIDYQKKTHLDGKITFKHQGLNYTVIIETKA